tara:strand:- start:322 stop:672 length:351 start_codon:yes stop_codon:yes gene_type:complete
MKQLTKFTVYSTTILTAYLISEFLVGFLNSYYKENTYSSVAIGMLVVLIVYFPIVTFLDKYIKQMSKSYVNKSKTLNKNSGLGIIIGFLIMFFVLFILFALVWHDLNLLKDLKNMF